MTRLKDKQQTVQFNEQILQEIIRRVVEVAHPEKIILFGSAARGKMGPNSDVDLVVVMNTSAHRRRTSQTIYRHLIGVGFAADIVVVTDEDIEQYKDHPGLIIRSALEEGKIVYVK